MPTRSGDESERKPLGPDGDLGSTVPRPARLLAEAAGTFALTAVAGTAGIMGAVTGNQIDTLAKAVAPGLLVMALIYSTGDASGAHFNPAVSLGFALRRVFPWRWLGAYWIAQVAGAIVAGLFLRMVFGDAIDAATTKLHVPVASGFAIEVFLSSILLTVILGTADRFQIVGPNAALAVGGTIALAGLIAEPLTGASMNPARSVGPAIAAGNLSDLSIYVAAPIVGMLIGVAFTTAIHGQPTGDKQVEAAVGSKDK